MYFIQICCRQFYLQKYIPKLHRTLTKIRLSAHTLAVETGRYRNIERIEIICINCNLNTIEDEYQFLLECPTYDNLRRKYIKQFYWKRPSVYKVILLLSVKNIKELNQLSKYIYECNTLRVT